MNDDIPLIPVPFRGDTLYLVQHRGEPYVPMRPLVEGMGLSWPRQYRKLTEPDDMERFSVAVLATVGAADRKKRELVCIPLRRVFGWMMTIQPKKVRPALRERIVRYQQECDEILWQHWTRRAVAPDCSLMPYLALTRGRWGRNLTPNGYNAVSLNMALVVDYLLKHYANGDWYEISDRKLSDAIGVERTSVRKISKKLEGWGLIERDVARGLPTRIRVLAESLQQALLDSGKLLPLGAVPRIGKVH